MRPHVGAVVADEDGDVADDANSLLGAVRAQSTPLLEKRKLQEALFLQLVVQFLLQLLHRFGATVHDVLRPPIPRLIPESLAQRAEQNVVFQPPEVLAAE